MRRLTFPEQSITIHGLLTPSLQCEGDTPLKNRRDWLYFGIIAGFAVLLAFGVLINTPR
jgi:hypothetical protein